MVPLLLVLSLLFSAAAAADTVEKHRLDPMNVQYEGIDVNGDEFADAICCNLVTGEKMLLLGLSSGKTERLQMGDLTAAEKAKFPDTITEVDLNGDQIDDLVVVNLGKLKKASGDDTLFMRVLEYSIYFGKRGGGFRTQRFINFSEEQRELISKTARKALLGP